MGLYQECWLLGLIKPDEQGNSPKPRTSQCQYMMDGQKEYSGADGILTKERGKILFELSLIAV